jgi:hypothetical protein
LTDASRIFDPAATPRDGVARLNAEIVKIVNSPDFRKRMDDIGAIPIGNSSAQMAAQIKTDTERYAKVVKDAKASIEQAGARVEEFIMANAPAASSLVSETIRTWVTAMVCLTSTV